MLFYFQFQAKPRTSNDELMGGDMVVHALIDEATIDQAAERVVLRMSSLYLKIGDVRRACVIRDVEEMAHEPRLLQLHGTLDKTGYAFVVELANGGDAVGGAPLNAFVLQEKMEG